MSKVIRADRVFAVDVFAGPQCFQTVFAYADEVERDTWDVEIRMPIAFVPSDIKEDIQTAMREEGLYGRISHIGYGVMNFENV